MPTDGRPTIPYVNVIVCSELSGKELHRQVGVDKGDATGSLGGVMASTLTLKARDVGSIQTLSSIFPIVITPMTLSICKYRLVLPGSELPTRMLFMLTYCREGRYD